MRTAVDWRTTSRENYKDFCKKSPTLEVSFEEWKETLYLFSTHFKNYILETGEKAKLPCGLGEFSVNKRKRKKIRVQDGEEKINLPIDWVKSKEKGKRIYNFNFDTEGFFFGWTWFKHSSRFKYSNFWYFRPSRATSRLLAHYIKSDNKYQHLYREWYT